jgi:uncharacterized protein YjbI with pentapeptide repeats
VNKIIVLFFYLFVAINALAYGDLNEILENNFCEAYCKDFPAISYRRQHFEKADLRFGEFDCMNFSEANFSGADFKFSSLICANMSNTNLSDADLSNANVLGANFTNALLSNAHAKSDSIRGGVGHAFTVFTGGIHGLYFNGWDLSKGTLTKDNVIFIPLKKYEKSWPDSAPKSLKLRSEFK